MAVSVSCRVSSHKTLAKIVYVLDLSHKCYTESDDHGPSRTMHDTPQEQPPRSLLKWKGVDQDGQSWVAIAICLSHTHARTPYTHARTHALTPRTHMHACIHAHTHTPTHASTLTSPALRQVQTAVSKATTHGRLPAALGSWSCIHVPTCRIRCAEVCAEAGNWGCKRAVKLTPRDRSACACGVHAWS